MRLSVPKESRPGERRVALVPESVKKLIAAGHTVTVQRGAGEASHFPDGAYADAGATIEPDADRVLSEAGMVLRVGVPMVGGERDEVSRMREGSMLLTSLFPARNLEVVRALAAGKITAFSTDAIPRTTRAQAMDTLSSMANISGYRGVLIGAMELGRYFPMLTTAAGTVFSAKVFVIGAGVAGLSAIATARRLGAQVSATDVRPEVKEQIESVGAKYIGVELKQSAQAGGGYARELSEEDARRQRELLAEQCSVSDVVITTALIGGVVAPRLIGAEIVRRMRPGSVIVDLAADGGGNCELSRPGETVQEGGVTIAAPLNLPATMPTHASVLWSRNLTNFVLAFTKEKEFQIDPSDEILNGAMITRGGEVVHQRTRDQLSK